jgi:CubicO group peptidase (beta-lactamase class C family)
MVGFTYGQMTTEKSNAFQSVLDKTIDGKKVFGTSFIIKKDTSVWQGSSGNLSKNQSYFIASTTKLFTTAIILKLKSLSKLSLDDKISDYLDKDIFYQKVQKDT